MSSMFFSDIRTSTVTFSFIPLIVPPLSSFAKSFMSATNDNHPAIQSPRTWFGMLLSRSLVLHTNSYISSSVLEVLLEKFLKKCTRWIILCWHMLHSACHTCCDTRRSYCLLSLSLGTSCDPPIHTNELRFLACGTECFTPSSLHGMCSPLADR